MTGRSTLKACTIAVAAAVLALGALPASADDGTTVRGVVGCTSTFVTGVWVEAANGGSGWAELSDPPIVFGNQGKLTYSKWLPNGGPVELHVGCGGDHEHWNSSNESEQFDQQDAELLCNSLPWWVKPLQKRFAPNPLRSMDLSQGIPTGHCVLVH